MVSRSSQIKVRSEVRTEKLIFQRERASEIVVRHALATLPVTLVSRVFTAMVSGAVSKEPIRDSTKVTILFLCSGVLGVLPWFYLDHRMWITRDRDKLEFLLTGKARGINI